MDEKQQVTTPNLADSVWATYMISVTSATIAELCKYFHANSSKNEEKTIILYTFSNISLGFDENTIANTRRNGKIGCQSNTEFSSDKGKTRPLILI